MSFQHSFLHLATPGGRWLTAGDNPTQPSPSRPQHRPAEPQVSPQSPRVSLSRDLEMGKGSPRHARKECRERSLAWYLAPLSAHPAGPSASGHVRPDVAVPRAGQGPKGPLGFRGRDHHSGPGARSSPYVRLIPTFPGSRGSARVSGLRLSLAPWGPGA